jgi:hypothetical protein
VDSTFDSGAAVNLEKIAIVNSLFSFITAIVAMGCVTALIGTWMRRRGANNLPSNELLRRLDEISERLAQLDGAVDTMAVEVERISEAQRFTARILAERVPAAQLPEPQRPAGYTTPH